MKENYCYYYTGVYYACFVCILKRSALLRALACRPRRADCTVTCARKPPLFNHFVEDAVLCVVLSARVGCALVLAAVPYCISQ